MISPSLRSWLLTGLMSVSAGALFYKLDTPLPWMIGPLLVTAIGRLSGLTLATPKGTRNLGQWILGVALGLYFTPLAAAQTLGLLPAIIVGAVLAVAFGGLCSLGLSRLAGTDATTSFFSAMPGGASEMSILAERYGARPDLVAAAHTLRVVLVVVCIPALYYMLDLHGNAPVSDSASQVVPLQLTLLGLAGAGGALVWKALGQANAWILGPLFVTAVATGTGLVETQIPSALSGAGQLFIGTSLGCRFTPGFMREAPRFLSASLLTTALLSVLLSLAAFVIAHLAHLDTPSTILGLSPGGIAEMCITAKALHLSVPVVTSFHVIRAMVVVVLAGPAYQLSRRWLA
ncbi:AbrB family transcriptional regulator [Granulosicoccaceae sp. 1_MG-2023]|nr:AbrB family transcriptional regulator [Granulosicoccaceae sp. 1_MG-2023]